ncbi:hypothetical protein TIFTF001_004661 [Ficus carica]|uniref:Uncharacterized protein n=1 Tax=Ficus carica TaxID=3494 RepID=A0AA87ZK02_FICCA|nr:hypothetical protein TIFTF001_004661 [Ficus carica]
MGYFPAEHNAWGISGDILSLGFYPNSFSFPLILPFNFHPTAPDSLPDYFTIFLSFFPPYFWQSFDSAKRLVLWWDCYVINSAIIVSFHKSTVFVDIKAKAPTRWRRFCTAFRASSTTSFIFVFSGELVVSGKGKSSSKSVAPSAKIEVKTVQRSFIHFELHICLLQQK